MSAPVVIVGTGLAGYNLAKEWRKLDAQTPLLLITADASAGTQRSLLAAGATAVLSKPLHVPTFLATLRQHLDVARTPPPEPDHEQP